jgi:Fe-S cluster assembly protein SufD
MSDRLQNFQNFLNTFDEKKFSELMKKLDEPYYLKEERLKTFNKYNLDESINLQNENWRKVDLSKIIFKDNNGDFSKYDDAKIALNIRKQIKNNNIIVKPLRVAYLENENLLKYFDNKKEESKLSLLNQSFWSNGIFLYIPSNIKLENPINLELFYGNQNVFLLPRILILGGEKSIFTIISKFSSSDSNAQVFFNGCINIILKENARCNFIQIYNLDKNYNNFSTSKIILEENSYLKNILFASHNNFTKANLEIILNGQNSESDIYGAILGKSAEFFEFDTIQDHVSSNTRSNLLFKSAVMDYSKSVFNGLINVREEAVNSISYQSNKNLLIGENASVTTIPKLEIKQNDVQAGHGGSASTIDQDQLFYMQARGIKLEEAKKMLIFGFFDDVIEHISNYPVYREIIKEIERLS